MEKRTPHCKPAVVKTKLAADKVRTTVSALAGGAAWRFGFEEIICEVAALTPRGLLQEYDDTRRSLDLAGRLGSKMAAGEVYLKLTVLDDVPIVCFKEL